MTIFFFLNPKDHTVQPQPILKKLLGLGTAKYLPYQIIQQPGPRTKAIVSYEEKKNSFI